ncbi:MAG: GntR family transcriptional regulator [Candidatus Promineifilaceae bacterium]|nr:GntR family transcriptional regulator [Candidatus Promineifilaceae bacterium]
MSQANRPVSLSQQAYDEIKHKIVTLELAPGSVLDEAELQAELGLGRTPIREALKRLAQESLVSIVPRRGMFVTDIGINDLQRLLEVRLQLETLAARLAAQRGTKKHWKKLEELVAEQSTIDMGDNDTFIRIDDSFHEIIYEAADNRFLRDALTVLLTLNERLWYYFLPEIGRLQLAADDHHQIMESLKAGDGDEAAARMARHIQRLQERLQSILLGMPPEQSGS